MASYNQVRDSCSSNNRRHGCSKAQMCLNKILSIISTVPPYETPKIRDEEPKVDGNNRGVGVDLNLRLGSFVGAQESESQAENGNLSACSFVGKAAETDQSDSVAESTGVLPAVLEKSSEGECDPKEEPAQAVADKAQEVSEITNQRVESSEIDEEETKKLEEEEEEEEEGGDDNGEVKTSALEKGRENESNDYLGLLVQAARLISGNFGDDEADSGEPSQEKELSGTRNESSKSGSKRKKNKKSWRVVDWLGEVEEDTSPVVRSKRGRTQVLPTRYRDSVLEPWKPLSRPQRSSTTTTVSRIYPGSR